MLAVLGPWAYYGVFACPFAVPFVNCQTCPVLTCPGRILSLFWGFWLLVPASVLLFGRSFCGWACPGGLVNQLIGRLDSRKAHIRSGSHGVVATGVYAGLVLTLFLWVGLHNPQWVVPIREGNFWESTLSTFGQADYFWLIRTFTVLLLVLAGSVAANFWCRHACPAAGALEIFKRFALFGVCRTGECSDCGDCLRICEMGARPGGKNCTNCGDCLQVCPENAVRIGRLAPQDDVVHSMVDQSG